MGRRTAARRTRWVTGAAGLLVVGLLWAALSLSPVHRVLRDASITPVPGFVPGAVDALVAVVNAVRDVSPYVTVAALALSILYAVEGRTSERGRTINRLSRIEYAGIDHLDRTRGDRRARGEGVRAFFSGTGLAILAVVLVGATSGIEHEVTNGPLRPVESLQDFLGVGDSVTYVLQAPDLTFMDDSSVPEDQVRRLVAGSSAVVVPFGKHLFNIDETSALEVSVPDALYERATGATGASSCADRTVIVDDTVGASVGDSVRINGVALTVAGVREGIAQMNRSIAILSDSTVRECVLKGTSTAYFGALVATDDVDRVSADLAGAGVDAVAVPESTFRENNRDFWRANATPLLLQLILYIALFSGFAAAGERQSSLQRNSREIGMLNATGVDFAALAAIERRRALRVTLTATLVAAPVMVPVAAAFNASELGVHIGIGATEVAVGFSITLLAMLVASQRALRRFRRTLDLPLAVKG
ncbi:hypothetical protein QI633_01525 [Nocardioides sp. QY071]|uniref:hypothetical protein n=1 Tax=Nocardioides sp. QY071 TaxID=3044187 RepID=UPI00249A094F|nr:hypothetical protein [Nocardioides sp. QY071]WGY02448.1 hypothetical protein QI633_01525 [Nocardioides sp. QY071]